jgi:DNA ligase (NAD+)
VIEIKELESKLREAAEAYYNSTPILEDEEFDVLRDQLQQLDPANAFLQEVGAKTTNSVWPKAHHQMPMGSQLKITSFLELEKWATKYTQQNLFWSEKLDGSSLEVVYENGLLKQAITRGDGVIGDDITPNVKLMQGLPHQINIQGVVSVRCEIIMLLSTWSSHFVGDSNPRNTSAGLARRKTGAEDCRHLLVLAYDLQSMLPVQTKTEIFQTLKNNGFLVPQHGFVQDLVSMQSIMDDYQTSLRQNLDYEIDGLIIEENNLDFQRELGVVDNRPRASRAYKFKSLGAETVLKDVVWQVGRSVISPVGILEPVAVGGVVVQRVSLCNKNEIQRLGLKIGSKVYVARMNDVIPKIIKAEGGDTDISLPTVCPHCSHPVSEDDVRISCFNKLCSATAKEEILHYLKEMGVKGLADQTVEKFQQSGKLQDVSDLYELTPEDFASLDGGSFKVGEKVAQDLKTKSRNVAPHVFIGALGIALFGSKKAEEVLQVLPTLEELRKASVNDLVKIPQIGLASATAIVDGLYEKSGLIDRLLQYVTLNDTSKNSEGPLKGLAVCFTGFRDPQWEDAIKANGGRVVSGVSKKTTHLVVESLASSSTKTRKAKELGVTLMGKDEFAKFLARSTQWF